MSLLEWNSSLEVCHETIDTQHRSLIDLINRLHTSYVERRSPEDIKRVLLELYRYTAYHFREEEALMEAARYGGMAAHLDEHNTFVQRLDELADRVKNGDLHIRTETFFWLVEWLLDHISVTDKKLAACLNKGEPGPRHGT